MSIKLYIYRQNTIASKDIKNTKIDADSGYFIRRFSTITNVSVPVVPHIPFRNRYEKFQKLIIFASMVRLAINFLFISLVLSAVSCRNRKDLLTEQEAVRVIERFDEGWNNKNFKLVDSVLAPEYIYFTQSGGVFSRDSLVQTAGSSSYQLSRSFRSAFVVHLNGNVAIVSTRWEGVGTYRGVPFNEDQRCSITVIKNKGKVQILTEHCTPIKPLELFH